MIRLVSKQKRSLERRLENHMKLVIDQIEAARKRCIEIVAASPSERFGAPVSATQIHELASALSPAHVKLARAQRKQLAQRADKSLLSSQLDDKTRALIVHANSSYRKSWSRKSAVMLVALVDVTSTKRAGAKSARKSNSTKRASRKRAVAGAGK